MRGTDYHLTHGSLPAIDFSLILLSYKDREELTMIRLYPVNRLKGTINVPASKPLFQRALLLATLAHGESYIHGICECSETKLLSEACQGFGGTVCYDGNTAIIRGVNGKLHVPKHMLNVDGSGFAARTLISIACLAPGPTILSGDSSLVVRPLQPLIAVLTGLGARIEPIAPPRLFPLVNWGGGLDGGDVIIPSGMTSQFTTAILLSAPYYARSLHARLSGNLVSEGYMDLTMRSMQLFGVKVRRSEDFREIEVLSTGGYTAAEVSIGPDVTCLFYFIMAALVTDVDIYVGGVQTQDDPIFDQAINIGKMLGVKIVEEDRGMRIRSGIPPLNRIELQAEGFPTFVPALAAIGRYLPHGLTLRGASHLRYHKTSRLEIILEELHNLGYGFSPVYQENALDGFQTCSPLLQTASIVDCHGDHRLFMALAVAALGTQRPIGILGEKCLSASFPGFIETISKLGVETEYVDDSITD
jgi:3-phosphoshikimate 1-carboxyvinyltransferase